MRDELAKTLLRTVLFPGSPAVNSGGRRLVYSSGRGRICAKCGWPEADCHCSSRLGAPEEPVPEKVTAKLSLEKRGSGKVVTVIAGLPDNREFLETLARELKRSCGTGGRVGAAEVEIQGDYRERLRDLFGRKGWIVKG
jgi:translation initiation factor 1